MQSRVGSVGGACSTYPETRQHNCRTSSISSSVNKVERAGARTLYSGVLYQ